MRPPPPLDSTFRVCCSCPLALGAHPAGKAAAPAGKAPAGKGAATVGGKPRPTSVIDFDRLLVDRSEEKSFDVVNSCAIAVAWRLDLAALVSSAPEFKVTPTGACARACVCFLPAPLLRSCVHPCVTIHSQLPGCCCAMSWVGAVPGFWTAWRHGRERCTCNG